MNVATYHIPCIEIEGKKKTLFGGIVRTRTRNYYRLFVWTFIEKIKAKKPSKLKVVTENSSSNPKKSALFCIFLKIFM